MVKDVRAPRRLDSIGVAFDDPRSVSDGGLLLAATLCERLGLGELVERIVDLGERAGASRPARKVLTLVHAMLAGADSIDDCDVLRSGATEAVLGHRVLAPSTLGTFLRSFTFGHVRQLERVLAEMIRRAWSAGAGPGAGRLVIDLDSFVGEVHGYQKQGAAYGYTKELGYHPLLATRAGTGEVLAIRLRKGSANTQRGVERFLSELLARVRRAGATGQILIRADSGFWRKATFEQLERAGILYSIGVRMQGHIPAAIATIAEDAWTTLDDYPEPGFAQIAETIVDGRRLVVRRVRDLAEGPQSELFESWRHHAFITNREEEIKVVEPEHRAHAAIELAIRDLKAGPLAHFPSGSFAANGAWTQIGAIAHNLARWTQTIGLAPEPSPRTIFDAG